MRASNIPVSIFASLSVLVTCCDNNSSEQESKERILTKRFSAKIAEYSTTPGTLTTGKQSLEGRVLVLERYLSNLILTGGTFTREVLLKKVGEDSTLDGKYKPSGLTYALPLVPLNPEEVDMIVLLDYDLVNVGSYTQDIKAYKWTCKVTTIDRRKGVVSGDAVTLAGGEPPSSVHHRTLFKANAGTSPEVGAYLSKIYSWEKVKTAPSVNSRKQAIPVLE